MHSYTYLDTPTGHLLLLASAHGLRGVYFVGEAHCPKLAGDWTEDPRQGVLHLTARQLREYFIHARRAFDLPLDAVGTEFQRNVWRMLGRIPYGETRSYADLARAIGNPNAMRAVGAANARNPISIVVPCHRVVGSRGGLTGYAGGLTPKQLLLQHESHRHQERTT